MKMYIYSILYCIFYLHCAQIEFLLVIWSLKRLSTDLWGAWVEVVAESGCTDGSGFRVVRWNGDGVAAGRPLSARRCFPLSGVWRQRRSVSLHKTQHALENPIVRDEVISILQHFTHPSMGFWYFVTFLFCLSRFRLEMLHLLQRLGQTARQSAAS